jgi:energy-coupling factor transport system ATP-binding protein
MWKIRQKVAFVFQNPDNQLIATTVAEDVAFGPENLGFPPEKIAEQVTTALKKVGMEEYRDAAPHLLSGGQKQRVAIAGALAMNPDYLVMDEATSMLDPQGRQEVLRTLQTLNQNYGLTIIYITHFMEEVVFAHRVAVMDGGKIKKIGTPKEIFSQSEDKELGVFGFGASGDFPF